MASGNEPKRRSFGDGWLAPVLLLTAILAALFHRSFHPDFVLRANDGPLGALESQAEYILSNFTGTWQGLNWIGAQQPGSLPNLSVLVMLLIGPVGFLKFGYGLALLLLGVCAWFFFRRLGMKPATCILGAIAAALDSNAFSSACWGLPSWVFTRALVLLALALLVQPQKRPWVQTALAGVVLGLGICDGFDTGAIYSLFVAAFVLYQALAINGSSPRKSWLGGVRVGVVALFAAVMAAQVLSTLVGTQIKGVVEAQSQSENKRGQWEFATYWSLPKVETLRVIVPGLFGYLMDSPNGGGYWGAVGEQPGAPRSSGSGEYAGVLVVLLAAWAVSQALRRKASVYTETERKWVRFWGAAALIALLFAFGRHAPFYRLFYSLPFLSAIRNPIKFMHPFHLSMSILFGYGVHGLFRLYLEKTRGGTGSITGRLKTWWATAGSGGKTWTIGMIGILGASLLGWLMFSSARPEIERYLQATGFSADQATATFHFANREIAWYLVILIAAAGLLVLIMGGIFTGARSRWAPFLLGALLVGDLARADLPWIVYQNVPEKYATNPLLDLLRQLPDRPRVTALLVPKSRSYLVNEQGMFFGGLCNDWLQNQFQYYRIPSLDIIQMPRTPVMDDRFMTALLPQNNTNLSNCGRLWQLTNTRFVLGMTGFLDLLNQRVDPLQHRFRIYTNIAIIPKPGITAPTRVDDLAAVLTNNGPFALFEFTGALPRAALFTQWQSSQDDNATLQTLADPAFDPTQSVLVTGEAPGLSTAKSTAASPIPAGFNEYHPKDLVLRVKPESPSILLVNDRYDPSWKVWVDGRPAPLLRCNYLMRGVLLAPGSHHVEFRFEPPVTALYISLAGLLVGLGLTVFLVLAPVPAHPQPILETVAPKS